jgi:two-component SAPR family response regulator
MDGYLSKPITRDALNTVLRRWLTVDTLEPSEEITVAKG